MFSDLQRRTLSTRSTRFTRSTSGSIRSAGLAVSLAMLLVGVSGCGGESDDVVGLDANSAEDASVNEVDEVNEVTTAEADEAAPDVPSSDEAQPSQAAPSEPTVSTASDISCADGGTCTVGDTGPAGGIVFYVSAQPINAAEGMSSGGRYLEAAPADTGTRPAWCTGTPTADIYETEVGAGAANTLALLGCSDGAGLDAAAFELDGFDDCFLPSKDELNEMYVVLKSGSPAVGDLADDAYWSSSRATAQFVWAQHFETGGQGPTSPYTTSKFRTTGNLVRPIRAFG